MSDKTLTATIQALYQAMLAHDITALDTLLAEDAVYVHSTGLAETKAEFLHGVRDGLYEYAQVQPDTPRIIQTGDLAVVYTTLDFRGGKRGQPHPPVRLITTLVWSCRDAVWRLRLRHATRIP